MEFRSGFFKGVCFCVVFVGGSVSADQGLYGDGDSGHGNRNAGTKYGGLVSKLGSTF